MQRLPPLLKLLSDLGDSNYGVCHIMKITIAESNTDQGLLLQQPFCFNPSVLAGANKMPIIPVPMGSDQDRGKKKKT